MTCTPDNGCAGWAECRLGRTTFPREPRNTLSNAAYPLAGLIAWGLVGTPEALVMAAALTWLGLGSGGYHGFGGPSWRTADWSGMHAVFGALAPWLLLGPFSADVPFPLWVAMAAGSAVAGVLLPWRFRQVGKNGLLAVLLVLALVPAYFNGDRTMVVVALWFFLAGKAVWLLDKHTEALGYWGHAAWHVETAGAFLFLFLAGVV